MYRKIKHKPFSTLQKWARINISNTLPQFKPNEVPPPLFLVETKAQSLGTEDVFWVCQWFRENVGDHQLGGNI